MSGGQMNPVLVGSLVAALSGVAVGANGNDQQNLVGKGINLYINISAISGTTPTLTVTLQGKDPVSGQYYTILASAALATVAFTRLVVYPGIVAAANTAANDILPDIYRVIYSVGGTTPSVTATISASIIP